MQSYSVIYLFNNICKNISYVLLCTLYICEYDICNQSRRKTKLKPALFCLKIDFVSHSVSKITPMSTFTWSNSTCLVQKDL